MITPVSGKCVSVEDGVFKQFFPPVDFEIFGRRDRLTIVLRVLKLN